MLPRAFAGLLALSCAAALSNDATQVTPVIRQPPLASRKSSAVMTRRSFRSLALSGVVASALTPAVAGAAPATTAVTNCRQRRTSGDEDKKVYQGGVVCDEINTAAPTADDPPQYVGTKTGILYYDVFDAGTAAQAPRTPLVQGTRVVVDYKLTRDGFDGSDGGVVVASSSTAGSTPLEFAIGDGAANDAVEELVKTLPPRATRRATVPAAFQMLDQASGAAPAPAFLEVHPVVVPRGGSERAQITSGWWWRGA